MFFLLYTFCLHFYLINIHTFDYLDSRLCRLFTEVPTSLDNRGSTVIKSGFYNKAVEVAPNVSAEFAKEVAEKRCWGLNHLRSYFRAVHGQANTLRKMGRYEESLKKYLELEKLDSKFYR